MVAKKHPGRTVWGVGMPSQSPAGSPGGCEQFLPNFPVSGESEHGSSGGFVLLRTKTPVIWYILFLMYKDLFQDWTMCLAVGEKKFPFSGWDSSVLPRSELAVVLRG